MPGNSLGYPNVPVRRKLPGLVKASQTDVHLAWVVLILIKER